MKTKILSAIVALLSVICGFINAQTTTFSYTGSQQMFVVPANTYSVYIDAKGAQGNGTYGGYFGGNGGRVYGNINTNPTDTLYVYVGGQNGWNGGGTGAAGQNG